MKKKSVSAVIIIALLMLIPSVISIETYDEPKNVTINILVVVSAPQIILRLQPIC